MRAIAPRCIHLTNLATGHTERLEMRLISGNINYSSWSMRVWFALDAFEIPHDIEVVPLFEPGSSERICEYSRAGKLPVLIDGEMTVWDSLAILEHLADTHPHKRMRPRSIANRSHMRSVCAEMHAGFPAIRSTLHTNVRARFPGYGRTPEVMREVARIDELWCACREYHKGDGEFLFGELSLADAMYAPVVTRFRTYDIPLSEVASDYMQSILALPTMKRWDELAEREPFLIDRIEEDLKARGAYEYRR